LRLECDKTNPEHDKSSRDTGSSDLND